MASVRAHITYHGKPACECQYPASVVYGIQCEYESIAEAKRVASRLDLFSKSTSKNIPQRHYAVKVVRGWCPSFGEV